MTLIFASTRADIRRAVRLAHHQAEPATIVALEWEAQDEADRRGLPLRAFEEYLDDGRFREVTVRAYSWAAGWHREPEIAAALMSEGVELGRAVEYSLYYLFLTTLRTAATFRALLEREQPRRLVYFRKRYPTGSHLLVQQDELFYESMLEGLARQEGVSIEALPVAFDRKTYWKRLRQGIRIKSLPLGPVTLSLPLPGILFSGLLPLFHRRARDVTSGMAKVCFLSQDTQIHPLYSPLIRILVQAWDGDVINLAQSLGLRSGKSDGIQPYWVGDLVSLAERRRIRQDFADRWAAIQRSGNLKGAFIFQGINLWEVLRPRFSFLFRRQLPILAEAVLVVKRLAQDRGVRLLVGVNEVAEYFRAAILAGNAFGIPSLTLLHGLPTKLHRHFIGNEPFLATKMAVWGKRCAEIKVEQGVDQDRLVVTGAPVLDRLCQEAETLPRPSGEARRAALRRLGLDPNRKVVVFAPDHLNKGKLTYDITLSPAEHTRMVRSVLEAMGQIPEAQLVIKLKADDQSDQRVLWLVRRHGRGPVVIIRSIRWPELFVVADVLVIWHSTVGIEGLLYGLPMVTVNLTGRPDRVDYAKCGVAIGVYEEAGLADALRMALFCTEVREELRRAIPDFLAAYAGPLDGRSAERVLALINEMAATRSTQPSGRVHASKNGKNRKAP